MSGHSKWSTIKRKKGAQDAKRSKMFSRMVKEISVAVKEGGNDPEANPRLRMAINNAKGVNMPKDNIERAIKKASGKDAEDYLELTYEGYAPHGIAIYVECTTDNQQRTVSSIRSYFNKMDGSLAKNGSLSFLFDRKGVFRFKQNDWEQEELELELIDAGAEEIELDDGYFTITTSMDDFGSMMKKLEELGIETETSKLERIPHVRKELPLDKAQTVLKLIDMLDEDQDVQEVYHDLEITDELINEMN
ncbi:MAG: YebC/PmpR family DNA-binding transcriptional regulator [Bacteroidales bacterium]|nr:YebC/PmpR family DNA-binding transcriptional regulator [Bacteroidales bacterium]MCF8328419.1 YebC/PmpR family DNA-binding transcriptional regulator [Bacteroidales bacterium]